eukprot:3625770-Prymnesium_polylepis.1
MVAMDAMQNLSPGKTEELSIFFESSFFLDDEWVLLQLDKPFRQQHPRSLAVMRDLKAWNVSSALYDFFRDAASVQLPSAPWVTRAPKDRIRHVVITNDEVSDMGEHVILYEGGAPRVDHELVLASGYVNGVYMAELPGELRPLLKNKYLFRLAFGRKARYRYLMKGEGSKEMVGNTPIAAYEELELQSW